MTPIYVITQRHVAYLHCCGCLPVEPYPTHQLCDNRAPQYGSDWVGQTICKCTLCPQCLGTHCMEGTKTIDKLKSLKWKATTSLNQPCWFGISISTSTDCTILQGRGRLLKSNCTPTTFGLCTLALPWPRCALQVLLWWFSLSLSSCTDDHVVEEEETAMFCMNTSAILYKLLRKSLPVVIHQQGVNLMKEVKIMVRRCANCILTVKQPTIKYQSQSKTKPIKQAFQ